ncbi:MAG: DUF5752 family protein [Pirellulales bacterium]
MSIEPFAVIDCSLIRFATGRICSNLRELLEGIRTVPDMVLEHHIVRCPLEDHFELYEFPNDLARWCWDALGEHVLGEQLALVDPYQARSIEALRAELINAIEERVWALDHMPMCAPGLELHWVGSQLVAYDTGDRLATPTALVEALPRMSPRSLFYHVHDARRRTDKDTDDFSNWLEEYGADATLVEKLRSIDFYFLNLNQLRARILETFSQYGFATESHARVTV